MQKNRFLPLTLVTAPAGYGKSTLVSSWMERCDKPNAWLSLDENDNDLQLFLTYYMAALQTIFTGAVSNTMALVNSPNLPPLSTLVNILANELD